MTKIEYKYGMLFVVEQNKKHIWTVKLNPLNGVNFIYNKRTNKEWQLMTCEFVYNSIQFNEVVNSFPDYVHEYVWRLHEYTVRHKR